MYFLILGKTNSETPINICLTKMSKVISMCARNPFTKKKVL